MLTIASPYLAEKLSSFVVGQEQALEAVLSAICENLEIYFLNKSPKKNNVLLIGPTGSGKTEIFRTLNKVLKIPVLYTAITDYTPTGYKGKDPQKMAIDFKKNLSPDDYKNVTVLRKNFLIRKKALDLIKKTGIGGLEFKIILEYLATNVFLEDDEVFNMLCSRYGVKEKISKIRDIVEDTLIRLNKFIDLPSASYQTFMEKPLGIIFVDEIDKLLNKERSDDESFYRALQQFLLTMMEGNLVSYENETVDTSHITFILAGSFYQHSHEEFIPEFKSRLNAKVYLRRLDHKDYFKIIKIKGFDVSDALKDKLVDVQPDALLEIAKICEDLNRKEYLGARRLNEIWARILKFLNREIQISTIFPIVVDKNFVRWSMESTFDKYNKSFVKGYQEKSFKEKLDEEEKRSLLSLENEIKDSIIEEIVASCEITLKEVDCQLNLRLFKEFENRLFEVDSEGKSVLEHLIEKGAVKKITGKLISYLEEKLGSETVERIFKPIMPLSSSEKSEEESDFSSEWEEVDPLVIEEIFDNLDNFSF